MIMLAIFALMVNHNVEIENERLVAEIDLEVAFELT
jgi:hypothetical protein